MEKRQEDRRLSTICMFLATDQLLHDARVQREARLLVQYGFDVTIVTMNNPNLRHITDVGGARLEKIGVWSRLLPKTGLFLPLKYLEFFLRACVAGLRTGARWFHCHDLPTLPIGVIAARLTAGKVIYDSHEIWLGMPMSGLMRFWWSAVEGVLIGKVDSVICTDQFRAKWFKQTYGVDVHVLMNVPECKLASSSRNLREDINAAPDSIVGVHFGVLQPGRYIEEILQAIDFLPPTVHIVVVGPCGVNYRKHLECLKRKVLAPERIHLMDAVPAEKLISYVSGADFSFVLYSQAPLNNLLCSPNKLFESLSAGLPVIVTPNPLLKWIVQEENVGVVLDGDVTPRSIAAAVERLLGCSLSALRDNCLRAASRYCWEREKFNLLAVYAAAASSKLG